MRNILFAFCALLISGSVYAQDINIEAKMAYQLAEENFEAKEYTKALDYLSKAEKALGKKNPPMAYLKVMIANQIVYNEENANNYKGLENALIDLEKMEGKDAIGEDKLMEIYRVKMDLAERKSNFEKEGNRLMGIKKQYGEMIYRLASEFPKTETTVSDFFKSVPKSFGETRIEGIGVRTVVGKVTESRINNIIKHGSASLYSYAFEMDLNQFQLKSLETYEKGEDRVEQYEARQLLKKDIKKRENIERLVTVEDICKLLKISKQMWDDFTTGKDPLIDFFKYEDYFFVGYKIDEIGVDGEYKFFGMLIYKSTRIPHSREGEYIDFNIFKNTL